jgi:hypothetical protein
MKRRVRRQSSNLFLRYGDFPPLILPATGAGCFSSAAHNLFLDCTASQSTGKGCRIANQVSLLTPDSGVAAWQIIKELRLRAAEH